MKKIQGLTKPFLCILLGGLTFFYYLNSLSGQGAWLAAGIIAILVAACYLAIGILNITAGDKLSEKTKNLFHVLSIVAFPLFAFIAFLLSLIDTTSAGIAVGPNGWVLAITIIASSLSFSIFYIVQRVVPGNGVKRITLIFAAIFALTILINSLFTVAGNPIALGQLDVVYLFIDVVYVILLVDDILKMERQVFKAKASEEKNEEEPEEQPEEQPEEEPEVEQTKEEE